MTTLDNRPNTALLVIDVQNGVVTGNHERMLGLGLAHTAAYWLAALVLGWQLHRRSGALGTGWGRVATPCAVRSTPSTRSS